MARLLIILPLVVVVVDVFAIVDVALIDRRRVRAIPKAAWIVLIIVLPLLGALLWYLLGKQRRTAAAQSRPVAPDDDPAFLQRLGRDDDVDARIRRLEQELADLDDIPEGADPDRPVTPETPGATEKPTDGSSDTPSDSPRDQPRKD